MRPLATSWLATASNRRTSNPSDRGAVVAATGLERRSGLSRRVPPVHRALRRSNPRERQQTVQGERNAGLCDSFHRPCRGMLLRRLDSSLFPRYLNKGTSCLALDFARILYRAAWPWHLQRLVPARERNQNAFRAIDVQFQRRFDLIPNLVEVAKTYMRPRTRTLEAESPRARPAQSVLSAERHPGDAERWPVGRRSVQLHAGLGPDDLPEAYPLPTATQTDAVTEDLTTLPKRSVALTGVKNDSADWPSTPTRGFPQHSLWPHVTSPRPPPRDTGGAASRVLPAEGQF